MMSIVIKDLSQTDIEDLAAYYPQSRFPPARFRDNDMSRALPR